MKRNHIDQLQMPIPSVEANIIKDSYRHNVIDPLLGANNIGIELGVAKGVFSKRMVQSGKFSKFYGVDVYSDQHDTNEYKAALKNIGLLENYTLLRMTFDDALDLFEDNFFDFIYIDGYAHTGEEGGKTLANWYKKLKVGGIFSGDDYHPDWPLVMWAVNDFAKQTNTSLMATDKTESNNYCKYPSWFVKKHENPNKILSPSQRLQVLSDNEKKRISKKRKWRLKIRKIEQYIKGFKK